MTIRPLFATKSIAVIPGNPSAGLHGYVSVHYIDEFVKLFKELFKQQTAVLYNHSPIFPFAYLNKGQQRLFVNIDYNRDKIIPIVQFNLQDPTYAIYCPIGRIADITHVADELQSVSKHPVEIIDLTQSYANLFAAGSSWKMEKTGEDVIQDTQLIAQLKGRDFSSLRNTLRRAERQIDRIDPLTPANYLTAIKVFQDWKEQQGKKYFRVTIGRDIRLIDEYKDRVDFQTHFAYVYYSQGRAVAANFGCRSWTRDDWGIDVTCKADIDVYGAGDFAFQHLMKVMLDAGIRYVNDSGCTTPGNRISKGKWHPPQKIPMYKLVRT